MLKKRCIVTLLVLGMTLAATGHVWAAGDEAKGKPQTVCPVFGGNLDKNLYVDYQGQRIYFCCPGCPEAFMKEPEKYLQKMKEQGVTPEKTPAGK